MSKSKNNDVLIIDEQGYEIDLEDLIQSRANGFREHFKKRLEGGGLEAFPLRFASPEAAQRFVEVALEITEFGFKAGFDTATQEFTDCGIDEDGIEVIEPANDIRH